MSRTLTRLENGRIVNNLTDEVIDHPAIFFDKKTGTLHGWGNVETVYVRYDNMVNSLLKAGLPEIAQNYVMLELSGFTPKQQAYVIEQCVETSASTFPVRLYKHIMKNDAAEWIDDKMAQRVGRETNV